MIKDGTVADKNKMKEKTLEANLSNEDFKTLHLIIDHVQNDNRKKIATQLQNNKKTMVQEQAVSVLDLMGVPNAQDSVQRQMEKLNIHEKKYLLEGDYTSLLATESEQAEQVESYFKNHQNKLNILLIPFNMKITEKMMDGNKFRTSNDSGFIKTILYFYSTITNKQARTYICLRLVFLVLFLSLPLGSVYWLLNYLMGSMNYMHLFWGGVLSLALPSIWLAFNLKDLKHNPIKTYIKSDLDSFGSKNIKAYNAVSKALLVKGLDDYAFIPRSATIEKFLNKVSTDPVGNEILKQFSENRKKLMVAELVLLGMGFQEYLDADLDEIEMDSDRDVMLSLMK